MKKFPTSKILKGTLIVAALNVVILPAVLASPSITLSAFEIEQILLALNNENNKVVSHINKLESNKDSVDTLESSILQTANITDQANQVLLKYNREDIKSHLKIKAVRDQLESNINQLKTKNEAFKPILEQNKLFLNTVVQNAQLTVKKAEDKAKKTLSIDLPGLNEAKLELENALKEVDKAKELAKSSKEHTDKLVVLAKRVQKATEKVNNLIVELNIISQDNDKLNTKYQQELDRLINLLTSKIDEAKNPNLDLVQINSLVEQLKEANTQANRANEIISQDSKSNQQTKAKKDQLADLVKTSEQTIIALNSKAQQIKKDIDDQLDNLSKTINTATSNIEAANNLGAVNIEFSNAQNRISSDIKALKEKIQKVKYDEVLKTADELETKDQQNLANALTKAKSLVSNYLKEADQLTNEQRSSFESDVNKATTAEQLENIQKAIELTNLKEKTKKEINKLELISKQQKDQLNQSVDQQQNDQGIEQILESVNELNKQKESVKEGINQLNNASDQLTKKYNDQLVEADSSEKVQKLLADLKDLDTYKVEKKNEIDALNSLSETDKQNLYEELKSAETKEAIDSVVQKAKNLDQSKKDGLSTLASLSDLSEDDQKRFKSLINKSTTSDEANKTLEDAKALNEAKKSTKASLEALTNLSTEYKEELKQNVAGSVSLEAVNRIKEETTKLNNEKKLLIDNVNKLNDFESEQKNKFKEQIKNSKDLNELKELVNTLKEIDRSKEELKQLIDEPNNRVEDKDKQALKTELIKATTKEEVAKVKEKLELAKKKIDAIDKINAVSNIDEAKKQQFIQQIKDAQDGDQVDLILATARHDVVAVAKAKARSEVNKLKFISKKEKDQFIKSLDNLNVQNKDTYENKVKELTNKNKEKENLHKGLESKKELFSPTLQQKIKQQLVNEDEKTKYDALAQQYTELASTKEQIKQKINSLEWLGAKDKESLTKKLINQENASTSRAIETEANQLNTFKKNLTDSVQQLQNIDQSEKTTTKDRIKEAITKDQAQKLHDDLKLKSQKADAKNQVNSLNNINNRKQGYLNEIESASNESEISAIVNRAKNRSNLNKEKETAKNQIQNLNLISNEHKQRLKNEIDSRETVDKVNETLNWAKQLSELKAQNSFDKLKLTNLSKNTNEKAKYEQELLNADTKVAVTRLVNDYKAKENEIVKANQKIDQHNNLSTEVKNSFKTKIREAQTNKINDIINEAKTLDTNNYRNITTLNGLQYLNDTYKTNKAKEIKNQATTQASNAKLKEAVDFNNSKKEYADKINQFSLLTQKTKTDAISGLKNNDNQSSYKEKYDKLKEKEDIKKERLTLITTTSEITRKGREILDSQLRATDEDHELNRILEDVVMWRNEAKINSDITSSLNSSKAKIQELAASNQANSSQSLQSLNNFISQNTKNEEDTLDALKVKNKALKDGLRERIIKFNQSMSTKVDNTNTNASKPLNTINKDELTNTKNKLEADIEKYKSIKQSISSNFDQSFDQNGYDNVIAKSTQVLAKLNQKIQLVDKYQTINKTLLSSKLAEREKEWLESRLLKVARNPDVQMSELDGVQNDINNAINEQKRLLDAFADAEFDLNKTMDVLKDIDAISKNRQINASHQSIVQKYNNIMTTIKSRYDDSVNEGTLPQLTSEVTKLNDGLEIYATKFTKVKNYIIKHSGTEQIQTDAWDQYEKSTQNVRLELSKDGIKDYGYYKQTMETTLNSAFDDVKKLVFKKQIVEFIGNGRWSQPGQVSYNSHVNFTISNAYVENPSAKSKAQIKFVENKGYETTYPNMHINFNIRDVTNGYTGGHDIWTHEIYFHSSDDDKMVYRLQSKRYKQHTWFVINKMPSSTKYDRRLDPWAYKVDNDKKNWFTEEDLVLTEFKGQKVK